MAVTRAKPFIGQDVSALETPAALINLEAVDQNLAALRGQVGTSNIQIRTHFKSLKCGGLAAYLADQGFDKFMAAKLCEAEALADAGIRDIVIANQIIGETKIRRLTELAERCQ